MFDIGRMCVKIAGRDAGKKCVILEVLDNGYVLVDGETRRRKCNTKHLSPLKETITVSAKRDHDVIAKEFEKLGLKPMNTTAKEKKEKPKKQRKQKAKTEKPKKADKPKEVKKAATPKKEAAAKTPAKK